MDARPKFNFFKRNSERTLDVKKDPNLLKDPDLPGLQDIFTGPSLEKKRFTPNSPFHESQQFWKNTAQGFSRKCDCVVCVPPHHSSYVMLMLGVTLIQANQCVMLFVLLSEAVLMMLCDLLL